MTEELKVVLKRSEHTGFGFSLWGTTGPPHVIYDIVENSPAADCGVVEAGDVILKVNDTDVHRYTTKEVLKCLRLSDDLVTLELKRDPKLKALIKEQLANTKSPHYIDIETKNSYDYHQQISKITSPTHSQGSSGSGLGGIETSPAHQRYKSPTHLPQRHSTATSTSGHSRNSSNSSAQIYLGNDPANTAGINNTQGTTTTSSGTNTPTSCRPSRIPTALKPAPKHPVLHSPQHKRPKPSQIPTKASNGKPTATTPTNNATTNPLQHSNSYSGSANRYTSPTHKATDTLKEPEPNSAPPQPTKAPRFEAYMMTGDLILNLSRTPQSSNLLTAQAKKVDSLRDSPSRTPPSITRANGALAPKASGESSPTSSSSVDSPTHSVSSANSLQQQKEKKFAKGFQHQHQQENKENQSKQQHRESVNNSYNIDHQYRKDSLTNDTLQLCEELERDDDDEDVINEDHLNDLVEHSIAEAIRRKKLNQLQRKKQRQYLCHPNAKQPKYDYYRNEDEKHFQRHHKKYDENDLDEEDNDLDEEDNDDDEDDLNEDDEDDLENEEDQTNYDITNIETYNSGGSGCMVPDDNSDRQCLVSGDDEDEGEDDEECSVNSLAKASAAQRLKALKQKSYGKYKNRANTKGCDSVDCAARRHHHHHLQKHQQYSGSSSSSTTMKSEAICGTNTSQDETSFSVPTSPTSLSTPLLDKETANSVPTSPEPSSLEAVGGGAGSSSGTNSGGFSSNQQPDTNNVVRRHNGHVVRKCDSAGFRTSKSEDHLQQIQREGTAVIPIDIDEDVNSSLNTLLDTRHDSEDSQASNRDRIVWTYNAPLSQLQQQQLLQQQQQQQYSNNYVQHHNQHYHHQQQHQHHNQQQHTTSSQYNSHSSSISSSPQHSAGSPASPTSVSSSVMSSSGSKGALAICPTGGNGHAQQLQQQNMTNNYQNLTGNGSNNSGIVNPNGLFQYNQSNNGYGNGNNTYTSGLNPNNSYNGNGGGGNGAAYGSCSGGGGGGDHSVSEAISNISSPDYQDDDNLLSSRDLLGGMLVSDPSDSDSTILVSDTAALQRQQQRKQHEKLKLQQQQQSEHKLVIQVRGIDSNNTSPRSGSTDHKDSEDDVATLTDEQQTTILSAGGGGFSNLNTDIRDSSPPVSDDGSDVESLHSYHYSPKAVDMPSAIRLAKRLYSLDGFKKSDVSRHLSKNNDFSRAVADEYLKYFNFDKKSLDQALREFLQQFSLSGETQERERVLVHFSKRYLDCNLGAFNSQDAVHTLTCAIMLLNTDLHGQNIGRKMSCAEFIDNLSELNDGENFPKDILKYLYGAIKSHPLEWALDDDVTDIQMQRDDANNSNLGQNPFLDIPESSTAVEYKKGYVMRKCCYEANYKKTPFGKRSWKMFYCTLRDLVLFLHKDEHGFRKSQMSDNLHNAIRIHHALATRASDYTKKQHVFRLQTSDQSEYLFQTSDSKELQSWIETINYVCAAYSAQPLEGGVGSQKRFQRPLLPSAHTKLLLKEQLESHQHQVAQLEHELSEHKRASIPSKGLPLQNYKEKESYLQYELRRYKIYVSILSAKMLADQQQLDNPQISSINDEETDTFPALSGNVVPTRLQTSPTNNISSQQMQQSPQSTLQQPQTNQQSSNR